MHASGAEEVAAWYDGEFLTPFSLLSAQTQGYKTAAVPAAAAVDDHFFQVEGLPNLPPTTSVSYC